MNNIEELNRLKLEDYIFIIFIALALLNIYSNNLLKKEIIYNDIKYKETADKLFLIVIIVTILLYIYFFKRNYNAYMKSNNKKLKIKVLGSFLILVGATCLLLFQLTDSNTSLTPSI